MRVPYPCTLVNKSSHPLTLIYVQHNDDTWPIKKNIIRCFLISFIILQKHTFTWHTHDTKIIDNDNKHKIKINQYIHSLQQHMMPENEYKFFHLTSFCLPQKKKRNMWKTCAHCGYLEPYRISPFELEKCLKSCVFLFVCFVVDDEWVMDKNVIYLKRENMLRLWVAKYPLALVNLLLLLNWFHSILCMTLVKNWSFVI